MAPKLRLESVCYGLSLEIQTATFTPLSEDEQTSSERVENDAHDPHRKSAVSGHFLRLPIVA